MKCLLDIHCTSVKYIVLSCTIRYKIIIKIFPINQHKAFKHSYLLWRCDANNQPTPQTHTLYIQTWLCHMFSFQIKTKNQSWHPVSFKYVIKNIWLKLFYKSPKTQISPWAELQWKPPFFIITVFYQGLFAGGCCSTTLSSSHTLSLLLAFPSVPLVCGGTNGEVRFR